MPISGGPAPGGRGNRGSDATGLAHASPHAIARRFGPGFILPTVTQRERADSERYRDQPEARDARMAADERSHARLF